MIQNFDLVIVDLKRNVAACNLILYYQFVYKVTSEFLPKDLQAISQSEVHNGRQGDSSTMVDSSPHTGVLSLEASEVRSPLSMFSILQACEVAVVMALMSTPALHMLANARICFIPYWVNGPQLASKAGPVVHKDLSSRTYSLKCSQTIFMPKQKLCDELNTVVHIHALSDCARGGGQLHVVERACSSHALQDLEAPVLSRFHLRDQIQGLELKSRLQVVITHASSIHATL